MKKINKSLPPNPLTEFQAEHGESSWGTFRNNNDGLSYKELAKLIFVDQGQLCAYCEVRIESSPEESDLQRIEHFHEKADTSDVNQNWALEWRNVIGVCKGGSGRENKDSDGKTIHKTPENLSCDASKGRFVTKRVLPAGCEGYLINPLFLPASPCLFQFDRATGKLKPDVEACDDIVLEENIFDSTRELVDRTIEILNLNCDRLNQQRLELLYEYNRLVEKARRTNDRTIFVSLSERWFRCSWPEFFTTRRILLHKHAENYLRGTSYNG